MDDARRTLRLLKSYRSYRAGTIIQATPSLARHLVEAGLAAPEPQTSFLPAAAAKAVERAVAAAAVETR